MGADKRPTIWLDHNVLDQVPWDCNYRNYPACIYPVLIKKIFCYMCS